ncbi:MAG: hypothetical protein J6S13_01045 [Clostridia bacterium]|nr:hypothetical protein [Clostridia bacterium]
MDNIEIKAIADKWDEQTTKVLDLEELSLEELQQLLKDTYKVLNFFKGDEKVPKELSKLLLNLEEYLYYASVMEENEKGKGFYCWEEMLYIVKALEEGFIDGEYKCAYPELLVTDIVDNQYIINLETERIEQLTAAIRKNACEPI